MLRLLRGAGVPIERAPGFVGDGRAGNGNKRRRVRSVAWAPGHVVDAAVHVRSEQELRVLLEAPDPVQACREFAALGYLGGGAGS